MAANVNPSVCIPDDTPLSSTLQTIEYDGKKIIKQQKL